MRKISLHRDSISGPSSPWAFAIPTELRGPPRISLICSLFCALITCMYCVKNEPMHFNFVDLPWSPKCFGHSCGHLQGDFFENKGAIAMETCLNLSAIPSSSPSRLQSRDYNSPRVSAICITPYTPNNCNFIYFSNYHHYHRHIFVMGLGHLLTRSGLTYPELSSKFCHDSFCQLENSVSLPWVIYLHVVSSFSCK